MRAALVVAALALPSVAHAQLHADASVQAGGTKRFLGSKPGGDDAGFGPAAQIAAHIALFPLVHVGAYASHEISPLGGSDASRNITAGGLRAKIRLPLPAKKLRTWAFAGFGYAAVYAPSYARDVFVPDGLGGASRQRARVEGAGGGMFEVPIGIGASYKLFGPWALSAELGARVGLGHSGSVFDAPGPQLTLPDGVGQNLAPAGVDRFGLGLTVGVLLDL